MTHTLGVYHENVEWMIGDSTFTMKVTIVFTLKVYTKTTPGLYELLFMKYPEEHVYGETT